MLAAPTRFVALTNPFRSSNKIPINISPFSQYKPVVRTSVNLRFVVTMSTPAAAVNATVTDAGRGSITHVIFDMDGLLLGNFVVFFDLCSFV